MFNSFYLLQSVLVAKCCCQRVLFVIYVNPNYLKFIISNPVSIKEFPSLYPFLLLSLYFIITISIPHFNIELNSNIQFILLSPEYSRSKVLLPKSPSCHICYPTLFFKGLFTLASSHFSQD